MEEKWTKRYAYAIKAAIVLVMVIVLLIPMQMIDSMITERSSRQEEAMKDISSKWGEAQTLTGPVLVVPVKGEGNGLRHRYAYFLPDQLEINGDLQSHNRSRGIYNMAVYTSAIKLKGSFKRLVTDGLTAGITTGNLNFAEAYLAIGVTDLRGAKEMKAAWNGSPVVFVQGTGDDDLFASSIQAKVPVAGDSTDQHFDINLSLRGSRQFNFSPIGANTTINVSSNWTSPSFDGAVLPETRSIGSDSGFIAKWEMLSIGASFPQSWSGNHVKLNGSDVSVKLWPAIDTYQQSLRSVKYAVLIIGLTFLLFYFIELLQQRTVHPLQYMLIGLALCVFYTLLIAISEQLNFTIAYIIASIMTVGLIVFYLASVFKKLRTGLGIGGALAGLYAFLYVIIRSEDQALLMGSIGLFVILATVMFISRRIRWEQLSAPSASIQQ